MSRGLRFIVWAAVIGASASACTKKASPGPSPIAASSAVAKSADDKRPADAEGWPAGIDLGRLDAFKRKVFDLVVNREPSACGKGHSLLHSVRHDSACRASFYAVRYVARLADAGSSESEISTKLSQRFRAPHVPYIDVSQAPSKGALAGRVAIVEFADYECSHCKEAQALMPSLLAKYPNDLTLYFKHFPITSNNSLNAALAAAAAEKQGKFWQLNDKIWENFDHLKPALLEGLAKEIGLDFSRWYGDVGSEEVRGHVKRDQAEARSLEIHRTPGIFINGRRYTDDIDTAGLQDWIDEELGR
jgi:predicted DsbA family dithiol-disulfide isomerase